jgi:hypothetical protein
MFVSFSGGTAEKNQASVDPTAIDRLHSHNFVPERLRHFRLSTGVLDKRAHALMAIETSVCSFSKFIWSTFF